jgi:LacI family transcriptional regulator
LPQRHLFATEINLKKQYTFIMTRRVKQVTLKDIADALGVSVNTVSCALAGRNSLAPETVRRVKEKAEELGYIPNSIAVSMRTGYTKTIAIILGDIANAYFSIMVKELERRIRQEGYTAIILVTDEDANLEREAIATAISKNVDGIILFPTCRDDRGIQLMRKSDTPFILIGRRLSDAAMDYIVSDDVEGGYLATKFLLEQGRRKIIHFSGPDYVSSSFERKQGYIRAMEEAGAPHKDWIVSGEIILGETADERIAETLKVKKDFEGIFTYSDIIAFRTIRIARTLKIKIPAIVGYDNIQSKIDFGFDLPSINTHKTLMAEKAADRLFQRIRRTAKKDEYLNEVVPVDLYTGL